MKMTQYLKWKADSSKGEVFTPIELVCEMLDKIPNEVWKNPNSTFLDPCMGKGTFLLEIVRRLVYIYGYTEDDAKSRVYGYDIRVKYVNHLKRRGLKNVRHKDFLNEKIEMKFDVVLGNPPYQKKVGPRKTEALWNKFVLKIITITKESGYVSLIHPSGWRNISGNFKEVQNLYKEKNLVYLKMYSDTEGMKIFNASIYFDWFVLKNEDNLGQKTEIYSYNGTNYSRDISIMEFIPNGKFDEINSLIAKEGEEKVEIIFSFSDYETRKSHMSKDNDEEFIYPCVCNVAKDESITLMFSSTNQKGHFGVPKLICGGASSGSNFLVDENGLYGITQFSFGIVETPENLNNLKTALKSDRFQEIIKNIPNNSQAINHKILSKFRKDFWREFIDD
jgi:16S rRNA G966 N2-methylase RsmD